MEKQGATQERDVPIWMMHAKILGRKIVKEETQRQEREERFLTPDRKSA